MLLHSQSVCRAKILPCSCREIGTFEKKMKFWLFKLLCKNVIIYRNQANGKLSFIHIVVVLNIISVITVLISMTLRPFLLSNKLH